MPWSHDSHTGHDTKLMSWTCFPVNLRISHSWSQGFLGTNIMFNEWLGQPRQSFYNRQLSFFFLKWKTGRPQAFRIYNTQHNSLIGQASFKQNKKAWLGFLPLNNNFYMVDKDKHANKAWVKNIKWRNSRNIDAYISSNLKDNQK